MKNSDSVVYSTLSKQGVELPVEAVTKEFWILPDYTLGIGALGNTVEQVIRERTRTNMMLLTGMDIILIIAVILVFRNLKKEVNLAQNKSDFVSNVSHEIRTPLALISMFAETLEMDRVPTEEKKKEYYHIISKETQRLTGIVNKILTFSQTEANKKIYHFETLQVDEEINAILNTYDFHLRNKGFEYTYEGQDGLKIIADKQGLVEVIINLIDNAMKYSETKKRIEISCGRDGQHGYIRIKDYGVGISHHDQKHIFDKFYRVSSGNLAKTNGTGLGLSLVQKLMESQKGRITVSSDIGKGSIFTVYFPLASL
jgi:two-component system phosphate regulon sensor histidine kinase PhoR